MTQPTGRAVSHGAENLIALLLDQHTRIRRMFEQIKDVKDGDKREVFDALRELLAVHETAEELVLRPLSRECAGHRVTDNRDREESDAARMLETLEQFDVDSPQFDAQFDAFEQVVRQHIEAEEEQEFPAVQAACTAHQLEELGRRLLLVEKVVPTHPHPTIVGSPMAQGVGTPFAALIDRARDAFTKS